MTIETKLAWSLTVDINGNGLVMFNTELGWAERMSHTVEFIGIEDVADKLTTYFSNLELVPGFNLVENEEHVTSAEESIMAAIDSSNTPTVLQHLFDLASKSYYAVPQEHISSTTVFPEFQIYLINVPELSIGLTAKANAELQYGEIEDVEETTES